jgi:tRNA(fMet)-specific endonuclease VapC
MNGRLLDTNIVIALFANEAQIVTRLNTVEEIFLCSIVLGELCYGARKSSRVEDNLQRIDDFASVNSILACDEETARQYGYIKHMLKEKGKPLPENDIWIAALAIQHNLILITRDTHFDQVDGLIREKW